MWKVSSGIFLGWSLGANDAANIFGTGVATGLVKYRTAILMTAIFVLIGSWLEGSKCIETVSELSSLLPMEAFCCALAAGMTMTALTYFAVPASSSHAIIGAVLGAGILSGSAELSKLFKIFSCWLFTPISGLIFGYLLYRALGFLLDRTVSSVIHRKFLFYLGILIFGCYGSYTLGANNLANVTGVYVGSGLLSSKTASLIGGLSIASGVLTFSKKVMVTVGKGIAPLGPFSALVSVLATALTLHVFTQIGVPVSSSQAVVGAVVGVGMVGGLRTVGTRMLAKVLGGWVLTPLSGALITVILIKGMGIGR
jgi:PiT family inorganic phosphate transporter